MTRHSPGPWSFTKIHYPDRLAARKWCQVEIISAAGVVIGIASFDPGRVIREDEIERVAADARLIAAAPDLFAALWDVLFEFSRVAGDRVPPTDDAEWARIGESVAMARAALAKAEG